MARFRSWCAILVLVGCKQPFPDVPNLDGGVDAGLPGAGVGGACTQPGDCRVGLVCAADKHSCQPAGDKVPGSSCILSAECLPGYYCAMGQCKASGMVMEGGCARARATA